MQDILIGATIGFIAGFLCCALTVRNALKRKGLFETFIETVGQVDKK